MNPWLIWLIVLICINWNKTEYLWFMLAESLTKHLSAPEDTIRIFFSDDVRTGDRNIIEAEITASGLTIVHGLREASQMALMCARIKGKGNKVGLSARLFINHQHIGTNALGWGQLVPWMLETVTSKESISLWRKRFDSALTDPGMRQTMIAPPATNQEIADPEAQARMAALSDHVDMTVDYHEHD